MNTLSSLLKNLRNRTPVGSIEMFAGASAPTDWLVCDGSAVSRTTFSSLFSVIGTTYGAGDGSTTFNLPDMRGRMPLGVGDGTATGHTSHALASKGGNENAIVPYHNHSVSQVTNAIWGGNHWHAYGNSVLVIRSGVNNGGAGTYYPWGGANGQHTEETTHTHDLPAHNTDYVGTDGNTVGANMTPYLSVNFIIYAGKSAS